VRNRSGPGRRVAGGKGLFAGFVYVILYVILDPVFLALRIRLIRFVRLGRGRWLISPFFVAVLHSLLIGPSAWLEGFNSPANRKAHGHFGRVLQWNVSSWK
jgi:hypothetical protein